ncbi:MAG: hypothetical protein K2X27_17475, partial [Candidatus Obscuribacterales bacterium]|nr:hypothetical protein [Candidatus Obscuribacterales bacterium]
MADKDKVHVFGIRHHGPGSARSLLHGLQVLEPDCLLIEGPPDANDLLKHVLHEQMKPPVSILIYALDDLSKAAYYPFAVFSPEWQAISFALSRALPVRFMDLPQSNWLALDRAKEERSLKSEEEHLNEQPQGKSAAFNIRKDPLSWLAKAAGFDDSERWWENLVEHRRRDLEVFAAIREAMTTLRTELKEDELIADEYEPLREAYMRQTIRAAIKEGFQKIAVVCGAWHAPALKELPAAKEDQSLLKGLPKTKVEATWIPWTHGRLSFQSGYGAGVHSPGWYHHLWTSEDLVAERWMSNVARLLRDEDLDASSAHIIEAVRLAEALASMRGQALPGLTELTDAVQAVFCNGNQLPLHLIHEKLVVGELIGEVPPELPGTP